MLEPKTVDGIKQASIEERIQKKNVFKLSNLYFNLSKKTLGQNLKLENRNLNLSKFVNSVWERKFMWLVINYTPKGVNGNFRYFYKA